MTPDKLARKWLDELNRGKVNDCVITRVLDDTVEQAKIWRMPPPNENMDDPVQAYFIKEKGGAYLGCVLEAANNLYAYTLPAQRRKGIMKTALKQLILPHLLQQVPVLRVHIGKVAGTSDKAYSIAKKLALGSGFDILRETNEGCRLILDGGKLKERIYIKGRNIRLPKEKIGTLKSRLMTATVMVKQVQTELEYKTGISGYSEDLNDLAAALSCHAEKIGTAWFDKP